MVTLGSEGKDKDRIRQEHTVIGNDLAVFLCFVTYTLRLPFILSRKWGQ